MKNKRNLFEMFNKINKTTLNENFGDDTLEMIFELLVLGTLDIENTSTRLDGDVTYITINATHDSSIVEFIFKVIFNEEEQSDVFEIEDVTLKTFKYKSTSDDIDLNDDDLIDFNNENKDKMEDIIKQYVDIEPTIDDDEEIYENAINIIENIRQKELSHPNLDPHEIIAKIFDNFSDSKKEEIYDTIYKIIAKKWDINKLTKDEFANIAANMLGNTIGSVLTQFNESE